MTNHEETAGQKMKDFYWEKRNKAKENSKELGELLKKKEVDVGKDDPSKKVARPFTPEAGA